MSPIEQLSATARISQTPERITAAIADVRSWWSQNIIGNADTVGDEFVMYEREGGIRFCRFRVTEIDPGKRVVWRVEDSLLAFVQDVDEWTGSRVVFAVTPTAGGSRLDFTHEGLIRGEAECFDACSRGWTYYVTRSLPALITTGTGEPLARYAGAADDDRGAQR